MGRGKMATAGSRHVMESYREINDGLAVVPEAMMEIGHTHIYLLTTHTRRGGCQRRERCMLYWVFLTSLSSQGKQGHAVWLLTDTWICARGLAGCFSRGWWGLCTYMSLCARQNTTTCIRDQSRPPHPLLLQSACATHVPIIALSSLFKVYIRCLNMYRNSYCVLLFMCPWVNYLFLYSCNMLPARDLLSLDSFSTISTISAARFLRCPPQVCLSELTGTLMEL